jgi:hypothetical protein
MEVFGIPEDCQASILATRTGLGPTSIQLHLHLLLAFLQKELLEAVT